MDESFWYLVGIQVLSKDKVDFSLNVIYVTRTKSDKDRTVPMDETVREAISRAIKESASEYVFTNPETGKPYLDVKKPSRMPARMTGSTIFGSTICATRSGQGSPTLAWMW